VALAECCFGPRGSLGARIALSDTLRTDALLFGESPGRVVAATASAEALLSRARAHGVPARVVGETGGDRLRIGPEGGAPWIDAGVERLRAVWERALPRRLEEA